VLKLFFTTTRVVDNFTTSLMSEHESPREIEI
jgi:hypothetical protein